MLTPKKVLPKCDTLSTYIHIRSFKDIFHLGQVSIGCCFDQLFVDVPGLLCLKKFLQQLRQTLWTNRGETSESNCAKMSENREQWGQRTQMTQKCMFVHTSRGVADSGARGRNLGDSSWIVRPRSSTNLDFQVTVRVDLLHTAHLA